MADNTEKEQTYNDQDQEEFCSVVIPIFTGLTNAYQESQVDSCSFPLKPKHVWKASVRIIRSTRTRPSFFLRNEALSNGSVRYGFNKKITSMHSNERQFDKGKGARLLPCSSGLAF